MTQKLIIAFLATLVASQISYAQSADEIEAANRKKIEENKKKEAVNPVMAKASKRTPTEEQRVRRELVKTEQLIQQINSINNQVRQLADSDSSAAAILFDESKTAIEKVQSLIDSEQERRQEILRNQAKERATAERAAIRELQLQEAKRVASSPVSKPDAVKKPAPTKPKFTNNPLQVVLVRPYNNGDSTKVAILEAGAKTPVYGRVGSQMFGLLNGQRYTLESVEEDGESTRVRGRKRYKVVLSNNVGAITELYKD